RHQYHFSIKLREDHPGKYGFNKSLVGFQNHTVTIPNNEALHTVTVVQVDTDNQYTDHGLLAGRQRPGDVDSASEIEVAENNGGLRGRIYFCETNSGGWAIRK